MKMKFSFLFYFKMFLLANSEDPDQTPRSVASDLGLHCLPLSQKWDARLIWVKLRILAIIEPQHHKASKMTSAPSDNSDQHGHPPSLISLRCPFEATSGP